MEVRDCKERTPCSLVEGKMMTFSKIILIATALREHISSSLLLFIYLFIYLAALGLRCCAQAFSSCSERGYPSLRCTGSRARPSVVVHGLSCSTACGIFPDQGSNPPVSPAMADGFLTTAPPGKSLCSCLVEGHLFSFSFVHFYCTACTVSPGPM